jgi:hypothetical protein
MKIKSYNVDTKTLEPVLLENLCLCCESYAGACKKTLLGESPCYHCNSPKPNGAEIKTEETPDPNSGSISLKIISGERTLTVPRELLYVVPVAAVQA